MSRLKLLLVLLCVKLSRQANETEFKPLDDRVGPIIGEYLRPEETYPLREWAARLEGAIRQREAQFASLVRGFLRKYDNCNLTRGIELKRIDPVEDNGIEAEDVFGDIASYARRHVIKVHFSELLEDASEKAKRTAEEFAGRCEYARGGQVSGSSRHFIFMFSRTRSCSDDKLKMSLAYRFRSPNSSTVLHFQGHLFPLPEIAA